jgi:hypothetical protein
MRNDLPDFRIPVVLISTACGADIVQHTVIVEMDTFELQVYKRDKWEFDSYFTDQHSALDEARRLIKTTRHGGVRVLADKYDENTRASNCAVVFSQMLKGSEPKKRQKPGPTTDWRKQVAGKSNSVRRAAEGDFRAPRRPVAPAKKKSIVFKMFATAVSMLAIGVGVMVWLSGPIKF